MSSHSSAGTYLIALLVLTLQVRVVSAAISGVVWLRGTSSDIAKVHSVNASSELALLSNPGVGFARIYDLSADWVAPTPAAHVATDVAAAAFAQPLTYGHSFGAAVELGQPPDGSLVLLGEESVDTRVRRKIFSGKRGVAAADAVGAVISVDAGAGKGVAAGATGAADVKVQASANTNSSFNTNSTANTTAARQIPVVAARSWFSLFRFSLSVAFVVKSLCMATNIFYQLSPMPMINGFRAKGDTGDADLAPFIATAYGGWQWCFYGLFAYMVTSKTGFLVLVYSNVVGAVLGIYYVWAFSICCYSKAMKERTRIYYSVLSGLVLVQVVALSVLPCVNALFFSGLISSVWSTIASFAMLTTVPKVYETRSSASLPLPLLVMGTVSAFLWIICGVMLWDAWITFPNTIALSVNSFALYLCWKFPRQEEGEFSASPTPCLPEASVSEPGDFEARASPFLPSLDFLRFSSNSTPDPSGAAAHLAEEGVGLLSEEELARKYGTISGTGGTGDEF